MCNNPNLDHVNIQSLLKFYQSQDIEQKRKPGHISVTNSRKMTGNNLNLEFVNINAYSEFGQILFICSQDIERKQKSDINHRP